MRFPEVVLRLPDWVEQCLPDSDHILPALEDRMRFVIELSRLNVQHGTGGPFGAAVFEQDTGRLIAPGINMVIPSNSSIAHAEVMAIVVAQQRAGNYDLAGEGMPVCELVATTEPCVMCLGAIVWSGIRKVVCGARDEDARNIGFDEGPKPADWVQALQERGIEVRRDVLRDQACAVLAAYQQSGGQIYNPKMGNVS
jgi:tRNA(Arg) A34 adenosine deaminase TadA